ncbi:MAG TPA: VWA domain-containing protein [Acidimicrobiales bacterium]
MTEPVSRQPSRRPFPFSAVVGHEDLRMALILCAVDPAIGGVLLRGQKGSAKTTLARGLATLLPGDAPFVDLPVGASEDRLVGSIDLRAALTGGERRFAAGLLQAAHGGVLYVDEVNLLPDHLVDVLLDVAASGVNRVEREGVSHSHASRFVLVGSMNPEEGELRPQLLDRFGLSVEVVASLDPDERSEAVQRRLAFDADPEQFSATWHDAELALRTQLEGARPAQLAPEMILRVSTLCANAGAEGLRADLVICRAAAALAGWEDRRQVSESDVRRVADLALAHRRRRSPFEAPGMAADELESLLDDAFSGDEAGGSDDPGSGAPGTEAPDGDTSVAPGSSGDASSGDRPADGIPGDDGSEREQVVAPGPAPSRVRRIEASAPANASSTSGSKASGRRTMTLGDRGRLVSDRVPEPGRPLGSVAVTATVAAAATRQGGGATLAVEEEDLREAVRQERAANLVVLAVDASGSMGAHGRMAAAKGAVLALLTDAYQRRDRVALVTFRGNDAEIALRPTGSTEVAQARLSELPTGGRTPLAAGIDTALGLVRTATRGAYRPLLVVVSDGRATAAGGDKDPVQASLLAAEAVRRQGVSAVVVDAEVATSPDGAQVGVRLGLARPLAEAMGARYLTVDDLSAEAIAGAVRHVLPTN